MRLPIIAGNWKMNKTIDETVKLIGALNESVGHGLEKDVEVVVCPPFTALNRAKELLDGSSIKLGAQNMYCQPDGAYTGEISPVMLKDLGCDYVIIGHSERRKHFHETDDEVNTKVKTALEYGLRPIVCVGETLKQREDGITEELVSDQVQKAFNGIDSSEVSSIVVAYEPIWAIGTGMSATAEDAEKVISLIRDVISKMYSTDISERIRIQYGGSVKPANAKELMEQPNIDGALVGGASLDSASFAQIVEYK